MPKSPEYRTWEAMKKYADDLPLSPQEWRDLSAMSLIDRTRRVFGPGNVRWALSDAERADNERFYRAMRELPAVH